MGPPEPLLDTFGEEKNLLPLPAGYYYIVLTKQCVRAGMDSGGLGQPYGKFLNTVLKIQVPQRRVTSRSVNKTITSARTPFYARSHRHVNESAKSISNR